MADLRGMPAYRAGAARAVVALLLALTLMPAGAWAQEDAAALDAAADESWNADAALELIARARERRKQPYADSTLLDHASLARGHVYFYLDRNDSDERTLVKVDQLAVEVYWAAPNRTKQRIVGMRDVNFLPNQQIYHLDHLTVVQDEFGDVIRLGDGDEVSAVPHPAAPGADSIYDYRVADSLTLRLPGAPEPIRVYEVEVRPKQFDRPAFVGSIFLDRASADIVRMVFTFTPTSYVDRRLDYIRVSIENGLWNNRHWLPYEQRIEIRRQLPELNFLVGAVIQAVMRIGDYTFNQGLPPTLFVGAPVSTVSAEARESYPFDEGLLDGIEEYGLTPAPSMEVLRRRARELVRGRQLSGLPRLRLHVPNASALLRYNRAERVYVGTGFSYAVSDDARLELHAGQAMALGSPTLQATYRSSRHGEPGTEIQAYHLVIRDIGLQPGVPGTWNSLGAAITGSDFLDPYFTSGARIAWRSRVNGSWHLTASLTGERHRNARLADSTALLDKERTFRPVRTIQEGTAIEAGVALRRGSSDAGGLASGLEITGGTLAGRQWARPVVDIGWRRGLGPGPAIVEAHLSAGTILGQAPPQRLFLLGGQGTVPGYAYRSLGGRHFALLRLEASRALRAPWLGFRATAAAGWAAGAGEAPRDWQLQPTTGLRTSAGIGASLFYDILRVDLVRGFQSGGRWQTVFSVTPGLRDVF